MGEAEEGASEVYDIFINHRGPDTKKSVASLIYRPLIKYGLRVFIDQDELEAGDALYDKIKSAISSSSVHVAIFSVRYAESSWCLNELLDMLQSGCKVIPIFYDVKPGDLRQIMEGPYTEAFHKHQSRQDMKLVERWKDALRQASNISGMEFNTKEGDLGELVDEIVEKVLKEAKWKLLHVADHPVGLHEAVEDFNKFLKERQLSGATVVGIMGLDGSGKSTLVKQLYNCYLQSRMFKRYCFLSELNENDFAVLQQKLVRDLLGDDKYSISDTTKGKRNFQICLEGCGPVLIVLDGLDKEEQIESLLLPVKEDVVSEGSLILVTCHDKALLEAHQVNLFYHVKLLEGKDGHDLFCWYAFDPPKPPKHLEDLVEKFVEICCGFPLALIVLGRKLSMEQDRRYWEEQLKDLSRPNFPKIIVEKILKVRYDYLEEKKKEVFLDVAHFLVGEDTDLAVIVLEGLHGSGSICLKELQSKCLLDLEEIEHCKRPFAKGHGIQWRTKGSSKIRMHDLVRKMARQIASEDSYSFPKSKALRLCRLDNKSILQQLQFRGCPVRGIRCEYIDEPERQDEDIKEPRWPWSLPNMDKPEMTKIYGLRLLVLHNFRVPFPCNHLSGDLIWLRMHKSNWGNTIPSSLSLRNLRVLELDGVNFEAVDRMGGDKFPSKLGRIPMDYFGESAEIPERNLPSSSHVVKNSMEASSFASGSVWDWFRFRQPTDSVWGWFRFGELKDLVKMVLKNVKGFTSLPIDFKALKNLRHLDLTGWSDLRKMPDSFTGLLQLQYLALQDCVRLSVSDLGEITKLEYLDFEGCSLLRRLPDKTTAQLGLRYLNLMRASIEELPQDLGNLKRLEQLFITNSSLITLPDSFRKLGQLRILRLIETGISELCIPSEESLFPDLEIVDLTGSPSLREVQSLPCNLRILDISGCHNLKALNLEGLRSIEEIVAKDCFKLQSIQGLAQLRTLSYFNLSTFNKVPNSIWSEILGFPSNVSTVILGGANVLCMNAEEMGFVQLSILKEFQGATIIDIPTIEIFHAVPLRNIESYGAIILCFIAKKYFFDFEVHVGDDVYYIRRPYFVSHAKVQEEHEETPRAYTFMWSQNSNLFKDLTFHGKSVLDCTVQGLFAPLKESVTKAWIVMIRNRTDGVKICKQLLNSLCCIFKQAVHQVVAS